MKKTENKPKEVYVTINLKTFEVSAYKHRIDAATYAKVHRNTISGLKERRVCRDILIIPTILK